MDGHGRGRTVQIQNYYYAPTRQPSSSTKKKQLQLLGDDASVTCAMAPSSLRLGAKALNVTA
eukprot:1131153-Pyramimonas_sp.AAC.1